MFRQINPIEGLKQFLGILLIGILPVIHADHFIFRISQHAAQGIVEEGKITLDVNLVIAILDVRQNVSIALLGFPQGLLGPLALGKKLGVGDGPRNLGADPLGNS